MSELKHVSEETSLVPVEASNLFGAPSPVAVIDKAVEIARPLAQLIEDRGLYTLISGRKYVRVEGWSLLGAMLNTFPVVVWTRPVDGGWEARVEARRLSGEVVGAGEASCLRSERNWRDRDDFALRSMAQTRATGKALRVGLGFVIQLAGFEATPAEEMIEAHVIDEPHPHVDTPHPYVEAPKEPAHSCPSCGKLVKHNDDATRGKQPVWQCVNRDCQGGKPKRNGGNFPWGSYEKEFPETVRRFEHKPAAQIEARWDEPPLETYRP